MEDIQYATQTQLSRGSDWGPEDQGFDLLHLTFELIAVELQCINPTHDWVVLVCHFVTGYKKKKRKTATTENAMEKFSVVIKMTVQFSKHT